MADQDDKVLKGELTDENLPIQENSELPLHDGPTEEELAAAESAVLVHGERKETGESAMDAIDSNGELMTGIKVDEHREATRDKATGAMKLDFLGADDEEEEEMPSSEAKLEETPEPTNNNTGWVRDAESVAVTGATIAFDPTPAARLTEAAARAASKSDWVGEKGKKVAEQVENGARATREYMVRNQDHFEKRFLKNEEEGGQQKAA